MPSLNLAQTNTYGACLKLAIFHVKIHNVNGFLTR